MTLTSFLIMPGLIVVGAGIIVLLDWFGRRKERRSKHT
jgi:hypothetical protein